MIENHSPIDSDIARDIIGDGHALDSVSAADLTLSEADQSAITTAEFSRA